MPETFFVRQVIFTMATIKDVARLAGVSISTVSKYLNGGNIRQQNVEPIRSAIAQLGYKANPFARSLKVNRSHSIGILLPSINVSFYGNLFMPMDKLLREKGYHCLIACYDANHGLERECLSYLLSTGIDGLIYMPEDLSPEEFYELTAPYPIPVVQVDRAIQGLKIDSVLADNAGAVHDAVSFLHQKGHRRIAIISGPKSIFTSKERLVGYLRALSDFDIPYDDSLVFNGELSFATGYQNLQTLMAMDNPPTAIVCTNYDITIGAVTAAREQGYQLPSQIEIFGYDSVESCSIMNPQIPVVCQPEEEMGRTAAAFLLDRLSGDQSPARQVRLQCKLVD